MPGALDERLGVLVDDALVHEVAADREAYLPLVEERAPGARRRGRLDVGVLEHDEWAVPSNLEDEALEHAARGLADEVARGGRSGERNHPDVGVGDERVAHLAVARQHVQHALGQLRLLEESRDHDPTGDGGVTSGFRMTALPSARAGPTERMAST